jgi:hypothetical protein
VLLSRVLVAAMLSFVAVATDAAAATPPPAISVAGNHLINGAGQPVRLLGVNRSDTVYPCIQGWGLFDGPSDAASAAAIASWNTNAVRLQLNEDCWLNVNMGTSPYGGAVYQNAIVNYVSLLHQYGLYVILSLAWNAPGTNPAFGQQVMADADHAPAFWTSVAGTFRSDPAVLFDLYNEPHDVSWACWRDGTGCPVSWPVAGMQTLVSAVRTAGAPQPILLAGAAWATDLTQWLQYQPTDPTNALVASVHAYNITWCVTIACWNSYLLPVVQQVPVVSGELGENDCAHGFIDLFMGWADANGVSYLGFDWRTSGGCGTGPLLIAAFDGTPTNFGTGLRDHLAFLSSGH